MANNKMTVSFQYRRLACLFALSLLPAGVAFAQPLPDNPDVVLSIDMATGAATILNASDAVEYNLDSYSISSPNGLLDVGGTGWDPIAPDDGWEVAGGNTPLSTSNELAEFLSDRDPPNNGALLNLPATTGSRSIGNAFTADPSSQMIAAGLGNEYLDLEFVFRDFDDDQNSSNGLFTGAVVYENERINNLVLEVTVATGNMQLINESAEDLTIEFLGITDPGETNALNVAGYTGLTGLDRFPMPEDPDWELTAENTDSELAEFFAAPDDQGDTIMSGESLDLGNGFSAGSAERDLEFKFLFVDGLNSGFDGVVRYIEAAGLTGDYNENGVVDAADYTVWRDSLGGDGALLANRDPANAGPIGEDDYTSWKSNFGATSGSGSGALTAGAAVPEPSAVLLCLFGVLYVFATTGRRTLVLCSERRPSGECGLRRSTETCGFVTW